MKLKGPGDKTYNILFHTHTITGIVISFGLFVIFYAGAFSLFRHEITQWENPKTRQELNPNFDIEKALNKVDSAYNIDWHDHTTLLPPSEKNPLLTVYAHSADSAIEHASATISPKNYELTDIHHPITTVGNTMYVLHYFGQIPVIGLYLSGLVALFFLFATVTGVLIHWRNILNKFYAFITEGKWKNIWTNAHTVFGVIGLPFQIIYAVTGAFFGLLTLILIPSVFLLYNGDVSKVYNKVTPEDAIVLDENAPDYDHLSITELYAQMRETYPEHEVRYMVMRNYGKEDALVSFHIEDFKGLQSAGRIVMYMKDGKALPEYSAFPHKKTYSQSVINVLTKLHFADFGGITMKVIYFILSMITCFMIISGVLIWRTARDNHKYTLKQRVFHHNVTKIYLAICLSLFPAFTILFLTNKLVPMNLNHRVDLVNQIFFISWFLLTISGLFWNSYSRLNRNYMLLGGILSLMVPVVNGLTTGDWFWKAWETFPRVAYVDIFWLSAGLVAIYLVIKVLKVRNTTDKPTEEYEVSNSRFGKYSMKAVVLLNGMDR